jgi:glycosyltransferase involved in cell wall biosynthesis
MFSFFDAYQMRCLKRFEKMIVLTEGDASEWRKYMPRVEVIPNPVTFYPEKVLTHEVTKKRIICVGRLHEQKGFDMLIDAFSLIASKCPQWHIDFYGSGDDEFLLRQLILDRNLEGRIFIHEPSTDIYKEYQASDFLVLSSRYEGFGLVLVEAMSCGIPCLAFQCKYGPADVISDGENGMLVADGQIEDLADKMLWMIEHKEERLRMGEKARMKARNYQKDLIMKRWETLFNSFQKELQ